MSWEIMSDNTYRAICACGQGYYEFSERVEMDNWNRSRSHKTDVQCTCTHCHEQYHIETHGYEYLVPNGKTLNPIWKHEIYPNYSMKFAQYVVASYSPAELQQAYNDMATKKYSTKLSDDCAKNIVMFYKKKNNSVALNKIMPVLAECIQKYSEYPYTKLTLPQYNQAVRSYNHNMQQQVNHTLKECFQLQWHTI